MKIIIGKFILQSRDDRFDIFEIKKVEITDKNTKEKTGQVVEREVKKKADMRFCTAMEYVISRTLGDKEISVSCPQYIDMFKKERDKITNLLK